MLTLKDIAKLTEIFSSKQDLQTIIGDELSKQLDPIYQGLNKLEEKLEILWEQTVRLTVDITEVQDTLKSHTRILNIHTVALKRIEENTQQNNYKLNKRLTDVEDQLGITPLSELTILQ